MNNPASTDSARLFSAPRKYDMSTLLVVTTAYAVVFAFLSALSTPAVTILIVAAFLTLVALGQALLFGAKHPRRASALVGSTFYAIVVIVILLIDRDPASTEHPMISVLSMVFFIISGAFLGYVGGVVVGFVFMVAHGVRLILTPDSRTDLSDD